NQEVVTAVAANSGANFSDFAFLHAIKRSRGDSILAEQLGLRQDIPRQMFQQLIAKASADVRRKLEQERPELAGQIQTSIADVAGSLQSRFDPTTTESYVSARKIVTTRHQLGELKEAGILEYARAHQMEETTVGLSLLSALPIGAVERALADGEMTLILAKALNFEWETTMALLFLGAREHRIKASLLDSLKEEFARLTTKTSQDVLSSYKSRQHEL